MDPLPCSLTMDVVNEGLESFKGVLPPPLKEYWVALLISVTLFNVVLILGELLSLSRLATPPYYS